MFTENLPKKGPLFREFWTQKPTPMGGTYPYPQYVMLPPPPGAFLAVVGGITSSKFEVIQLFRGIRDSEFEGNIMSLENCSFSDSSETVRSMNHLKKGKFNIC